ncbi:hypothetical protein [Frankia gtarii]|uniref:hypothetical protein n=1 Tax=Frankia gtarii TaxID=2950102 RepID=UPI0021BE5BBA|nr:hypothetical protein [Frankia gtarii]
MGGDAGQARGLLPVARWLDGWDACASVRLMGGRGFGPTAIDGAQMIVRFAGGHETTRDLVTLARSTLLPLAWLVMVSRAPLQGGMTADAAPTWW